MADSLVLYLDVLGMATAVSMLSSAELESLSQCVWQWDMHQLSAPPAETMTARAFSVYRAYTQFHSCARTAVEAMTSWADCRVRSIAFSDSFFLATEDEALLIERLPLLLSDMCYRHVPVRGGVARGTFSHFALAVNAHEAGHLDVRSPILGSGVVRAYQAESCGLKGMRTFIHPSAVAAFERANRMHYVLPLPDDQVSDRATHELCFLVAVEGEQRRELDKLRGMVDAMQKTWGTEGASEHYDQTRAAMARWLELGCPPV